MMYQYEQPLDLRLKALNLSLNHQQQQQQTKPAVVVSRQQIQLPPAPLPIKINPVSHRLHLLQPHQSQQQAVFEQQQATFSNQHASHQQPRHQAPPEHAASLQQLPVNSITNKPPPILQQHQQQHQHQHLHQHQPAVRILPPAPHLQHQHSLPHHYQLPHQLYQQPKLTVNSQCTQQANQIIQQQTGSAAANAVHPPPMIRQHSLVSRFHCKPCGIHFSQLETLRAHQEGYCTKRDRSKSQIRSQSAFSPPILLSTDQENSANSNGSTTSSNSGSSSNISSASRMSSSK